MMWRGSATWLFFMILQKADLIPLCIYQKTQLDPFGLSANLPISAKVSGFVDLSDTKAGGIPE